MPLFFCLLPFLLVPACPGGVSLTVSPPLSSTGGGSITLLVVDDLVIDNFSIGDVSHGDKPFPVDVVLGLDFYSLPWASDIADVLSRAKKGQPCWSHVQRSNLRVLAVRGESFPVRHVDCVLQVEAPGISA